MFRFIGLACLVLVGACGAPAAQRPHTAGLSNQPHLAAPFACGGGPGFALLVDGATIQDGTTEGAASATVSQSRPLEVRIQRDARSAGTLDSVEAWVLPAGTQDGSEALQHADSESQAHGRASGSNNAASVTVARPADLAPGPYELLISQRLSSRASGCQGQSSEVTTLLHLTVV